MQYKSKEIAKSRKEALLKIKDFLDTENVDEQFKDRVKNYYSKDKFIVTWKGNYNGMASEMAIQICDPIYTSYSGHKCIYSNSGLFHEKQLQGYTSIERALIDVGLKLCDKEEKKLFFDKYVTKYNERLRSEREKK